MIVRKFKDKRHSMFFLIKWLKKVTADASCYNKNKLMIKQKKIRQKGPMEEKLRVTIITVGKDKLWEPITKNRQHHREPTRTATVLQELGAQAGLFILSPGPSLLRHSLVKPSCTQGLQFPGNEVGRKTPWAQHRKTDVKNRIAWKSGVTHTEQATWQTKAFLTRWLLEGGTSESLWGNGIQR